MDLHRVLLKSRDGFPSILSGLQRDELFTIGSYEDIRYIGMDTSDRRKSRHAACGGRFVA